MGVIFLSSLVSAMLLGVVPACPLAAQHRSASAKPAAVGPAGNYRSANGLVTANGLVEARHTSPLLAPGHGWVREVFFADGDYVRGRQILVKYLATGAHSNEFNRNYLLAPHAGFLVKRNVAVGHRVGPGTCVATLQDVSYVRVAVVVSPPVGRTVQVGDAVAVRVAELPGRTFAGVVERLSHQPLPQSKTMVLITVRNAVAPLVRPLMHASVSWNAHQLPPSVAKR